MAEVKKTFGAAIGPTASAVPSGPPSSPSEEMGSEEVPQSPYSFLECVHDIERVVTRLEKEGDAIRGRELAIGKLKGAIVKLQQAGN